MKRIHCIPLKKEVGISEKSETARYPVQSREHFAIFSCHLVFRCPLSNMFEEYFWAKSPFTPSVGAMDINALQCQKIFSSWILVQTFRHSLAVESNRGGIPSILSPGHLRQRRHRSLVQRPPALQQIEIEQGELSSHSMERFLLLLLRHSLNTGCLKAIGALTG